MHRAYTTPLVIAIMAFAVVAFLFLIDTAINPDGSKKLTNTVTVNKNTNAVACTLEAKLCPDGSSVGRSGPDCEFAECPAVNTNSSSQNSNTANDSTIGWKAYTSKQYGLTFKYPSEWEVEEGTLNGPYSVVAHPKAASGTPTLRFWLDYSYDGMQTPSGAKTTRENVTYAKRSAVLSRTSTSTGELLIAHVQFSTTPIGWGSASTISILPDDAGSIEIPLQILETLTITDATAGWKTFTNETYKYSMKYPETYAKITTPNGDISVRFDKGKENTTGYQFLSISVITNVTDTSSEVNSIYQWAKNGFSFTAPITAYHQNPRREKLGGETFVVTDGDKASSGIPEYLLFKNNLLYYISSYSGNGTQFSNRELIATMTFPDPTAGWKTYTNSQYNFTIKYPPKWAVAETKKDPEQVLISDTVSFSEPKSNNGVRICPLGACQPFQDGVWDQKTTSSNIGGRVATRTDFTYNEEKSGSPWPSNTHIIRITFDVEPSGWDSGYNFSVSPGNEMTGLLLLSTFTFTD